MEAIISMSESDPTDNPGLIRLLGMVTYVNKFYKNFTVLTRPLQHVRRAVVGFKKVLLLFHSSCAFLYRSDKPVEGVCGIPYIES